MGDFGEALMMMHLGRGIPPSRNDKGEIPKRPCPSSRAPQNGFLGITQMGKKNINAKSISKRTHLCEEHLPIPPPPLTS